jgi:RecJ-like exonuclease
MSLDVEEDADETDVLVATRLQQVLVERIVDVIGAASSHSFREQYSSLDWLLHERSEEVKDATSNAIGRVADPINDVKMSVYTLFFP